MSYFSKKGKEPTKSLEEDHPSVEAPVLTEEDEAFLHRIATEGTPPPLPERPPPLPSRPQDLPVAGEPETNNAQIVLFDGAQNIPLPSAPETPADEIATAIENERPQTPETVKGKEKQKDKRPFKWSFLRRDSRDSKRKAKNDTATDLEAVAATLKSPNAQPNEDQIVSDPEAKKEEEEMTAIMDELNLAAVNNKVFSISDESKDLLHKYFNTSSSPIKKEQHH
ncbi:MAG: hypothetical protein Q9174_002879 [Haloplaca sp. 1 TL-2023]